MLEFRSWEVAFGVALGPLWARHGAGAEPGTEQIEAKRGSRICFGGLGKIKNNSLKTQILNEICYKKHRKLYKKQRMKNALESDFLKHQPNFRGTGVDFERHVEASFGTKKAREAIPEGRF